MAAFSMDLRTRIFEAWQRGEDTQEGLACLFGVSLSWLVKLLGRWRRTGSLAPLPHGGGQTPRLDGEEEDLVATRIAQKPDITLGELKNELERRTGTVASGPTLCRVCQRLGLPRKKKRCMPPNGSGRTFRGNVAPGNSIRWSWTPSTP